jgi:hypothetical protein
MATLKIALFVEGSEAPPPPRGERPLVRIWNDGLAKALRIQPFNHVVPISKKHLVAMDPKAPKMSGAGEPLDHLIARELKREPFDAAVVVWDLVPAWNPAAKCCRWTETLDLYRLLADSIVLSSEWRKCARKRFDELNDRPMPRQRSRTPTLCQSMVVALCLEPMFEGLLTNDEGAVKRALGLGGRHPAGWPRSGWGDSSVTDPDIRLLVPAIRSLLALTPRPRAARIVRGDFRTNKDGWGEYLLRGLLKEQAARSQVLKHTACLRLQEWLPRVAAGK